MRRARESVASPPPAVLVRAASCRSARLPVRCSGLGQPGNGLLRVLDRRPHLDRRSRLASRPGRVTPARHSAAPQRSRRRPLLPNPTGRISRGPHRHLDAGSVSASSMLTSPSSALIDSSRTGYRSCTRRRPSLQQQGPCSPLKTQEKRGAAVRDVAPSTAAGAHSRPLRGFAVLRRSPVHPRARGAISLRTRSSRRVKGSSPPARGAVGVRDWTSVPVQRRPSGWCSRFPLRPEQRSFARASRTVVRMFPTSASATARPDTASLVVFSVCRPCRTAAANAVSSSTVNSHCLGLFWNSVPRSGYTSATCPIPSCRIRA